MISLFLILSLILLCFGQTLVNQPEPENQNTG